MPSSTAESQQTEAEAYAFRQLVAHLQMRTDVQNIELMILSGFCRNCLSKWYHVGAAHAGVAMSYDDACERVYGMSYKEWKTTHQSKASDEQLQRLEETKAHHAKHSAPPPVPSSAVSVPPPPAPTPAPPASTATSGMSDVCCIPEEELVATAADGMACAMRTAPLVVPPVGPVDIRLGILTVSDRASKGAYEDLSGPAIADAMRAFAGTPSGARWRLEVARSACVEDDVGAIDRELRAWSDPAEGGAEGVRAACNLILTSGGTGLAVRDVTPEATSALLDRATPGITELILRESLRVEPLAALSRAAAGIRRRTLIINLPGRPKAVRENLHVLMPLLGHCLVGL